MPLPANLFWTHPQGDPTTVPCTHIVQQHPNGDRTNVPCTHVVQEHPNGHRNPNPISVLPDLPRTPCIHFRQQHANDVLTTPCVHVGQQHPGGHPGPEVPCFHPVAMVREESNLHLKFFTGNATIQSETIAAATRLKDLGISVGTTIRPLCIFNRAPINGNPDDNDDPFWSHYSPLFHSIQITRRSGALDVQRLRDTLHHEMGHATIGQSLIDIPGGGNHTLTGASDPGVAMSEGWAHFIALVIRFARTELNPTYDGMAWGRRDSSVACSPNIEYNVGCLLWDLFDSPSDGPTPNRPGADTVVLPLSELFRVYSPTLTTILNGPVIPSVGNYLERLENNNPSLRSRIERLRPLNCC